MKQTLEILLLVVFLSIRCGWSIELNGQWTGYIGYLNGTDDYEDSDLVSFPATVPGGAYTDLVKSGLIPKNLIGANDLYNRWIGNESFTYVTYFNVTENFLMAANATLTFYGLDTFAIIFINNKPIDKTSNMFLRYHFNVKNQLKPGRNELKVVFISPIKIANELYEQQSLDYVVPPKCVPKLYNGECHVNHIRKMQASFGWDWGPAFPSVGIWKKVELFPVDKAAVTDISVDIYKRVEAWEIVITVFLTTVPGGDEAVVCNLLAALEIDNDTRISNVASVTLNTDGENVNTSLVLNVPDSYIKRWWPNGYGEQILYSLLLEVRTLNDVTHRTMNIGFRTVELVQKPLAEGLSFYFKVNEVPIFAKGSNWIPSSIFPELSAEEETVRYLLRSAKETHMNMLRVWGGGMYESDMFYELADEYGIMIWQDFMFACSMYPATNPFLESVSQEITQNVRRLQYHASIVLWAGNNENEAALYGDWYGTGNKKVYKDDYIRLYEDVIKQNVESLDPIRSFVVSSPSDGLYSDKNKFLWPDPYSNLYGDVHYYNYILNGWNINQYPRTRFASEYGFQSIPSIATMASAAEKLSDLQMNSEFMQHRQHLLNGYDYMTTLVSMNFIIPKSKNATKDLINFIYLSQVNQAVSVRIQTESYRQARSEVNGGGQGMTMGALYWQLNDVWQAPSWSSIEFGGRWKMLHYYALEFFAPVIVTPRVSAADELEIYVVSDKLAPIKGCNLTINIYNWHSLVPIQVKNMTDLTINPNAAKKVAKAWLGDYLKHAGCGPLASVKKNCIMEFMLTDNDGKRIAPYNYVFPGPLKAVNLPLAEITVRIDGAPVPGALSNYMDFIIELTSSKIALFVWLELDTIAGRFSENGFHIFRGKKVIVFHAEEAVTDEEIMKRLMVTTLSDLYDPNRRMPHFNIGYSG